jgi:TonB family protein
MESNVASICTLQKWFGVALTGAVLSVRADIGAAQNQPIPDDPPLAQTSLGFNAKSRCPDLRIADEGTIAVVVFWVPRSGIPSRISIKSSSGSDALDSAALSCVSKLRFAPLTRSGDAEPIDAWQQIAWRWAEPSRPEEARAMSPPAAVASPQAPATSLQAAPSAAGVAAAGAAAEGRPNDSHGQPNSVTVHVCVDATGKLKQEPTIVHSSGNAQLDEAAVKIAAAGSAYYRPSTASNKPPASGCAQLAIKFEAQ